MKEPTREQIKEAFKKTLERWEKIVEDVSYFDKSECALCLLESTDDEIYTCSQLCPIRLHTVKGSCHGTPYGDFFQVRTPTNALAELNFLRKVYIWWIEGEGKDVKEKPREEWEDVTNDIKWELENLGAGYYWMVGCIDKKEVFYFNSKGLFFNQPQYNKDYKIDIYDGDQFRILRKI